MMFSKIFEKIGKQPMNVMDNTEAFVYIRDKKYAITGVLMKTEEKGIRKLRLISISKFTNFNMHDIRHRTNLYDDYL